jgi:O-acetyl-ADP-ribose deacetylase (regulator of RNase III)
MENQVVRKRDFPLERVFELVHGDLTTETVDAIVNPANNRLDHGGGVAGLIVRKGGAQIQAESDAWVVEHGLIDHQHPAYTSAGTLPCRYVIHAVGPVWGSGDEDRKLVDAITGAFLLAGQLGVKSLSMPAISTGIFGFPLVRASRITLEAIQNLLEATPQNSLTQLRLVIFDQASLRPFMEEFDRRFPV